MKLAKRVQIYSDSRTVGYLYTSGLTSLFLANQIASVPQNFMYANCVVDI